MNDFIFSVIKALCIPCGMISSWSLMEKLIGCTVKFINTFTRIFRRMGMDNIEKDGNAHLMCRIDHIL